LIEGFLVTSQVYDSILCLGRIINKPRDKYLVYALHMQVYDNQLYLIA